MSVYPDPADVFRSAWVTDDGLYRYALTRSWTTGLGEQPARATTFIMLNPSTADAREDDPTIRRCVHFARAIGCDTLHVVNLYAYRATKPADALAASDPAGPQNLAMLRTALGQAARDDEPVIAAWGVHARPADVEQLLALPGAERLTCLGVTKDGHPRHPLYVKGDTTPIPYPVQRSEP